MYYTYVLRSHKTNRKYTGSCEDLEKRIQAHNAGDSKSTRHGVPWSLIYAEEFSNRADAMRKERYFKTGKGREELEQLIQKQS
jgi:putative endonuclease